MSSDFFPEGAGLLHILAKGTNGEIGEMFDLSKLSPKQREIERKYELPTNGDIEYAMVGMVNTVTRLLVQSGRENVTLREMHSIRFSQFVGVDQYWIITKKNVAATFRYRFGSNKPGELTAKIQLKNGENEQRGEFDLDVSNADMQNVRAFMSVVCLFAEEHEWKHFCIRQSGNFWSFRSPSGRKTEIVVYKAGLLKEKTARLFVEIEPKGYESPTEALEIIGRLEKQLDLSDSRQAKSFAELFG